MKHLKIILILVGLMAIADMLDGIIQFTNWQFIMGAIGGMLMSKEL